MSDERNAESSKPKRQRLTAEQKIARLQAQLSQLKTREQKRSRRIETREKIIIGGAVVKAMRNNVELRERVVALLREDVTREIDREVIKPWLSPISMQA